MPEYDPILDEWDFDVDSDCEDSDEYSDKYDGSIAGLMLAMEENDPD